MPTNQTPPPKPFAQTARGKGATWVAIAVSAVAGFEGLRTAAYRDPVGIPTICFGETAQVSMGMVKTVDECKDMLIDTLLETYQVLDRCAGTAIMRRMPDTTKAAYVSFIYNVGPGGKGRKDGFCTLKNGNSSSMLRYLKAGQFEASCNEFPKWATAIGGVKLPGLVTRRQKEMALCKQGLPNWGPPETLSINWTVVMQPTA